MITAICIDDNRVDLSIIRTFLSTNPNVGLKESFSDPREAVSYLKDNKVDIIFTDIEMDDLNGLEVLSQVEYNPMVVFISSHPKYAADSFQFEPLNYIVKPVSETDIITSIERAKSRLKGLSTKNFIIVKSSYNEFNKLYLKNILFIEAEGDYLKIVCTDKELKTYDRIKNFKLQLPKEFRQPHRSYIVNMNKIDSIIEDVIHISSHLIPISRLYKKEIKLLFNK